MQSKTILTLAALAALGCVGASMNPAASSSGAGLELVVLSTTDVHGRIRAWDYYGDSAESARGLARAATVVDSVRKANPGRVLLVDAGDLLQGNPFAYIARKQFADSVNPIVAAMNSMGYDAAAVGNHEYNYGVPYLDGAAAQARFPFLSANTWNADGTRKFKSWTMVVRQGVRIGIVGATTPGVMVWDAENIRGKVKLTDVVPAVATAVAEARAAGAMVIVVTVHSGLNEPASYDTASTGLPSENVTERIAREVPGIDLIVYGHSHKEQADLHIGQTLLMQPKNWATSVGVAHLRMERSGGKWSVVSSRGEIIKTAGHAEQAGVIAASQRAHDASVAYANTVIGTTPVAWRGDSARLKDTPFSDLIAEVERRTAKADLASTAAFTLDAALAPGPITVARIAQLYPYENTLRAVRISGKQLKDYLEHSARYYVGVENGKPVTDPEIPGYNFDMVTGADYVIDLSRPIGSRITTLTFRGKPVAATDSFTMALNNYRQTGGGGYAMLKGAPVVYDEQQEIRQLLIDEVLARKTLRPADYFTRNWSLKYPGATSGASLRIITTNDLHGSLEPKEDASGVLRGGAGFMAGAVEQARNECKPACETLLLDAGDTFQGTPISNLAYGRPVVDIYNRMGYAAAALGNHELDWGVDTLRARIRQAKYGVFAANVRIGGARPGWLRADTIIVRGNTKIGVIGIITPETATAVLAENIRGFTFDDPAPIIDSRAKSLRARGADMIIVIAHEGGFCNTRSGAEACSGDIFDVARRVTEKVDLLVSGHTHSLLNTSVKGIPIVQAMSSGQAIAVVDIPVGTDGKPIGEAEADVRQVLAGAGAVSYAPVDSLIAIAAARVSAKVNRRIATIGAPLERQGSQYPLGNLVADAQRWAGKGDIAVMNNAGIRSRLPAGSITYGRLFVIQPFGNTLSRVSMTGAQVRAYVEKLVGGDAIGVHISGITVGYDPEKPKGQRVVSLRLPAGRTLSDNATYDVVMNNFIATGGSNLGPPEGSHIVPTGVSDLDALIRYLGQLRSPVTAPTDSRIFITQ